MSDEEKQAPEVVQEAGEEKTDEGATEEVPAESANKYFNHTYIRSIEGILRLITIVSKQNCHCAGCMQEWASLHWMIQMKFISK